MGLIICQRTPGGTPIHDQQRGLGKCTTDAMCVVTNENCYIDRQASHLRRFSLNFEWRRLAEGLSQAAVGQLAAASPMRAGDLFDNSN